jgi:hypothetical protein
MPVAMISTSTFALLRSFEVQLDDLKRLLGFERDCCAGLHESSPNGFRVAIATLEPFGQCVS